MVTLLSNLLKESFGGEIDKLTSQHSLNALEEKFHASVDHLVNELAI